MKPITANGYVRISKQAARKVYNSGCMVYLSPCYVHPWPDSPWCRLKPWEISQELDTWRKVDVDFDTAVTSYAARECNNKHGRYPAFYKKEARQ